MEMEKASGQGGCTINRITNSTTGLTLKVKQQLSGHFLGIEQNCSCIVDIILASSIVVISGRAEIAIPFQLKHFGFCVRASHLYAGKQESSGCRPQRYSLKCIVHEMAQNNVSPGTSSSG